jgi:hypothetical protein
MLCTIQLWGFHISIPHKICVCVCVCVYIFFFLLMFNLFLTPLAEICSWKYHNKLLYFDWIYCKYNLRNRLLWRL